jgi:cytoskeletal protein CcmA (bactofilin family)
MKYLVRLLVFLPLLFLASGAAHAAPERDTATVPAGTVHSGSYYVRDPAVVIDGEVDGDLVAVATENLTVRGTVKGSIIAFSTDIYLEPGSRVEGSVRVVGGSLHAAGWVGYDVTPAVQALDIQSQALINGNLYYWASSANVAGTVNGQTKDAHPMERKASWFSSLDVLAIGLLLLCALASAIGIRSKGKPVFSVGMVLLGIALLLLTVPVLVLGLIVPLLRLPALALLAWIGWSAFGAAYDACFFVGEIALRPWPRLTQRLIAVTVIGCLATAVLVSIPVLWVIPLIVLGGFLPGRMQTGKGA